MASSEALINRKWILKCRPQGAFDPKRDVELVEEEVDLGSLDVEEGKSVLKVEMLSVDAFVRTMLDKEAYHGAIEIGDVVPALGFGTVLKSGKGGPAVGTRLAGMVRAQTVATVKIGGMDGAQRMLPTFGLNPSTSLGLLGITTGMVAYVGIFSATNAPRKGEVCVISAAAGAVGNLAVQLAKSTGAKVIGIAGGASKCKWVKEECGADEVIDYKDQSKTVADRLDELCPDGINFYFDNVGGQILDDVLFRIAPKGRVVICGAISQYSGNLNVGKVEGPSNYLKLAERGATMVGFNVIQYMSSFPMGLWTLRTYYARGLLKNHETTIDGIESFPTALQGLFTGTQLGKTIVAVSKQ
jgi:NADPH-dependent curcumin reductase CurA